MGTKKISELPNMNPVSGDAIFEVSDEGNASKKLAISLLAEYIANAIDLVNIDLAGLTGFVKFNVRCGARGGISQQTAFANDNAPNPIAYVWAADGVSLAPFQLSALVRMMLHLQQSGAGQELNAYSNTYQFSLACDAAAETGAESGIDAGTESTTGDDLGMVTVTITPFQPADIDHFTGWWVINVAVDGDGLKNIVPSVMCDLAGYSPRAVFESAEPGPPA